MSFEHGFASAARSAPTLTLALNPLRTHSFPGSRGREALLSAGPMQSASRLSAVTARLLLKGFAQEPSEPTMAEHALGRG